MNKLAMLLSASEKVLAPQLYGELSWDEISDLTKILGTFDYDEEKVEKIGS